MELLTIIFEILVLVFKIACVSLGLLLVLGLLAGVIVGIDKNIKKLEQEEKKAKKDKK